MLKRIIEKNKSIKSFLLELDELYNTLIDSFEEIELLKDKNIDKYGKLISSYKKKSSALDILISDKNTKKLLVSDDFVNESNVFENNGFEYLPEKTAYKLKPKNSTLIEDFKIIPTNLGNKCSYTFLFNTKNTVVNKLECSFNDSILGYINPSSIKYIKNGVEYELRENFERYFDRKEAPFNSYYFYAKEMDGVKLYFDTPLVNLSHKVDFFFEEFEPYSEIIFKYPNSSQAQKMVVKFNYDDRLECLKFYIFKDNQFFKLDVLNKVAYIDNDFKDIIIKVEFDGELTKSSDKAVVDIKEETIIVEDFQQNYIDLCGDLEDLDLETELKFTANYSLMRDVSLYNDKAITIVQEEPTFSSDMILNIKSGETISDSMINRFNDLDDFEHLQFYKKELIAFDSVQKRVYFAKFLATDSYKFRITYKKKIMKEVASINSYTPFIFDISVAE